MKIETAYFIHVTDTELQALKSLSELREDKTATLALGKAQNGVVGPLNGQEKTLLEGMWKRIAPKRVFWAKKGAPQQATQSKPQHRYSQYQVNEPAHRLE